MPVSLQYFLKKEVQLIGTEGTRLLRGKRVQGSPAGERRGRTARGKQCLRKASAWSGNPLPFRQLSAKY
ncbi:hypothetical protein RCO48_23065 [Peribacillus frigoritolerans]|nr:hypothetical protein [Peribacillus frigoritolerans]